MTTVRDLIKAKGKKETYSVGATETVYRAVEMMAEANIGALMVTEADRIVGICTERDYTRKIILKGLASKETQVKITDPRQESWISCNTAKASFLSSALQSPV